MPPVLSIVGKSGSGKTTLIEKLVPELKRRGYRVGTIKHGTHRFEIDHPGKDSHRHFHAGADAVVIASSEKIAFIKRVQALPELDPMVSWLLEDVDLVIAEGYKSADKPKIEVFRAAVHPDPACGPNDGRIAWVTDDDIRTDEPRFSLNDVAGVADFIETALLQNTPKK